MFKAHSLGRLFGVDVRIHGTVFALAALIAFMSALSAGLSGAVASLVMIAIVFGSVTLHELGHVGASALFGGRTLGVTLYPFGGVAQLSRESRSGFEEIVVALAGPAVNFALAALFALPLLLTGPNELLVTLAGVNIALGIFNLIPAYPMDGGRVLRGALWGSLGKLRSTVVAASVGRWFAVAFAAVGLFVNPMLLIVAGFVFLQASQELSRARAALATTPEPPQFGGFRAPSQPRQVWIAQPIQTPNGVVLRWVPAFER